jgi:ABC-2 type transport system permease protein
MIFLIYLKNELKIQLRDKVSLVMLIAFPIILIFILSSAFGSMMNNKFELSPFSVGYSISLKSPIAGSMDEIEKSLKDVKITLVKLDRTAAMKEISNNKLAGYVEFTDTGYKFYSNDNTSIDAGIFSSVLQSISYQTGTYTELAKVLAQYRAAPPAQATLFTVEKLPALPFPSALTYYGIVMLISVLCFAATNPSGSIHQNRINNINKRVALTRINPYAVFFGKVVCTTISSIIQISVTILCLVFLLKVNFGSRYPIVIGMILLFAVVVNSVGIMLGYLLKNMAVTRTIIFALSFFLSYFGGCYVQYVYVAGSMLSLMQKDPLYYINRSLVELATRGSSSFTPTALIIMGSTILGSLLIGGVAFSRREGRLCNS